MNTITMTDVRPLLRANHLDETIAFYTTMLGFRLRNRLEHWCALESGSTVIMFYDHEDPRRETAHMTGSMYFYPTDVKALWESVRDKVIVEWKLQTMFYDMVEFGIRDCNGYILYFGQDVNEVAAPLPPRPEE